MLTAQNIREQYIKTWSYWNILYVWMKGNPSWSAALGIEVLLSFLLMHPRTTSPYPFFFSFFFSPFPPYLFLFWRPWVIFCPFVVSFFFSKKMNCPPVQTLACCLQLLIFGSEKSIWVLVMSKYLAFLYLTLYYHAILYYVRHCTCSVVHCTDGCFILLYQKRI